MKSIQNERFVLSLRPWSRLAALTLLLAAFAVPSFAITPVAELQFPTTNGGTPNVNTADIEPVIVSYTNFGVEYSCSVWMNFDPDASNPNSTLKYTAWTSSGSNSGVATIPAVAGYNRHADPVLVKHATLTRIFLAGVAFDTSVPGTLRSAIVVWYSTNGGWNWSTPRIVATATETTSNNITTGSKLDKPWIATAPDGRLWLTYITASGNSHSLSVHHGTLSSSTWNWSAAIPVTASNTVSTPQIAVDSNGDVYVLFLNGLLGVPKITMRRWDASTSPVSFTGAMEISLGSANWTPTNQYVQVAPGMPLRAFTCPIMKLDRTRRRIAVVWHQPNATYGTGIHLATLMTVQMPGMPAPGAWAKLTFAVTGGHDLQPTFDFDSTNGDMVVTWYAFPYQASHYFNLAKRVIFNSGGMPTWGSDENLTTRLGDISTLVPDASGNRLLGEYHDIVYTNGNFKASSIIVAPTSDTWAFTVTP